MKRLIWYRGILQARLDEWSEERINACTDYEEMRGVVKLTMRMERNEARLDRHMDRGLIWLDDPDNQRR